jgi:hypothetical protein
MKKRNLIIITILVIIGLIFSIYLMLSPLFKPIVGNDTDIHGCIPSAGYSWCETKQKCIRIWEENCSTTITPTCDYNSSIKTYIKQEPNCVINFLCIQGTTGFSDECGCGCEKINTEPEKIYCTPEQKTAQV